MYKAEVIVLAGGTGDLGRYLHEELIKDGRYSVALLTRKVPTGPTQIQPNQPLTQPTKTESSSLPSTTTHKTDYSESSILSVLTLTRATALISLIRCPDELYLPIHTNLLNACLKSPTCKRFIPSEWAGNIDDFPDLPRSYRDTRGPLRELLKRTSPELKWTLFNFGWFMEYFLPESKSYMKFLPGEFPIDPVSWTYCAKGNGEALQSWTYRPLKRVYRDATYIAASIEKYEKTGENDSEYVPEIEEWTVTGATACPREKTLRQYEKYFSSLRFLTIEEMLEKAEAEGHV
ncbi:hypothetical protein BDW62DRAFT_219992 [Aspergillus aurantiobrunneus]